MSDHYVGSAPTESGNGFINGRVSKLLERVTFLSLAAAVVAGLLIYAPVAWLGSPTLKIVVIAVCMAVSAVALFINSISSVKQQFQASLFVRYSIGAVFLLPATYAVSWYLSGHTLGFADGATVDTLLFTLFAAASFSVAALTVCTKHRVHKLLGAVLVAAGLAALYQYIVILTGTPWLQGSEHSTTATLVGKWNELGLLTTLGVFALISGAFPARSHMKAYGQAIALALMAFLLLIVNFDVAWYIVLIGSGALAIRRFVSSRERDADTQNGDDYAVNIRKYGIYAVAVLALLGATMGDQISTKLPAPFAVPAVEIRPSFATTMDLAKATNGGMFGTGPESFQQAWVMHKPLSINLTQFWSAEFPVGFSNITTALITTGWVGVLGWMMPLLAICVSGFFLFRRRDTLEAPVCRTSRALLLVAAAAWVGVLLYATGPMFAWLMFVLAGALVGYTATLLDGETLVVTTESSFGRMAILGGYAGLALVSVVAVCLFGRYAVSSAYLGQAAIAFSNNDIDGAQKLNAQSISTQPTEENLRLAMVIDYALLQKVAAEPTTPDTLDQQQKQFSIIFKDALAQASSTISLNPRDYRPYAEVAQFYEILVSLKVPGAADQAQNFYAVAQKLNPTNPAIPLLLARLKAVTGTSDNLNDVRQQLANAIQLKGNYTDAFLLAEQIAVALNDANSAIQAAEAAIQSSPNQPTLWFQLGMLFYATGNNENAAISFQKAIQFAPNQQYANAEYFLGVSKYKLGQIDQSAAVFRDILKNNPNNQEIQLILTSISEGKDPFQQTTPAAPAKKK